MRRAEVLLQRRTAGAVDPLSTPSVWRLLSAGSSAGCARPKAQSESERMSGDTIDVVDRLSVRARPPGLPIMHQNWGSLLFMHWPVPADLLRPLLPDPLSIDTHDGLAWVGITPFTMWGVRPAFAPSLPFLSKSHELNVRTYVHLDGVPGVCFFPWTRATRPPPSGLGWRSTCRTSGPA